jgi:hypothetical protein
MVSIHQLVTAPEKNGHFAFLKGMEGKAIELEVGTKPKNNLPI